MKYAVQTFEVGDRVMRHYAGQLEYGRIQEVCVHVSKYPEATRYTAVLESGEIVTGVPAYVFRLEGPLEALARCKD
jgi:hypothetical protein